jgi:hypothetical protein
MKYKRKTAFLTFAILTVLTVTTTFLPTGTAIASTVCGTPVMVTLYAGQYIDVGTATVWNDQTHLYIEFNTTGGWQLSQTHLAVATNLDNIPQTRLGNPIPGKFPFKMEYDPTVTEFTCLIDLSEWGEGTEICIASHAVVALEGYEETAWAEGSEFNGRNWATYFTYTVQPCEEEGTYVVASGAEYYDRPRINSNCEIVWSQKSSGTYQIWSNLRGQISFGNLDRDPDINDNGEIIWRFGDGGQGPDGIMSNDRGLIYSEQGGSIDPYHNTHRINNNGEIVWSRSLWPIGYRAEEIWSNIRGRLTYSPEYTTNRQTAINDEGEVVYRCYRAATGNTFDILSTEQGFITDDSLWQSYPDINNSGEVVWEEEGVIWSNTRGRITTNGLHPSINNSGEIVWEYFDGNDYEIYSNIRGQITDNDVNDNMPHINDSGVITWLSNNTVMATFQ